MNLLELQTRANALVQKVNEYEETIAGVELDEDEILNEHTYVDLFSLRMIMHRLFGKTPSDRSSNLTTTDGVTWYYLPTSKAGDLHLGNINENYYTYGSSSVPLGRTNDNNDLYTNYNMQVVDPNLSNASYYSEVTGEKQLLITSMAYTVFGADIRDALVTESQTANIFKWNTTSEDDVTSYASAYVVPQQVPGIVCYYLGSGYDGTYTATVPFNTSYSTNQPNNATPALYGAYYIDQNVGPGPSGIVSQQAENRGAEGLRMFMPGLTYFNGTSISPINIWQPFPRLDTNYGYNYQGKALYHELVFKRRRAGCKAAGLDFIPDVTVDNGICDNDPQGLAMRLALAQQKPYYYNRPWFKELDEYYTAEGTKQAQLADLIIENSKNISYEYNMDSYTVTGSALKDVSNGTVSNCSTSSYVSTKPEIDSAITLTDWTFEFALINPSTSLQSNNIIYFGTSFNSTGNPTSGLRLQYLEVSSIRAFTINLRTNSSSGSTFSFEYRDGELLTSGTNRFQIKNNSASNTIILSKYNDNSSSWEELVSSSGRSLYISSTANIYLATMPSFDLKYTSLRNDSTNIYLISPVQPGEEPIITTKTDNEFYNGYQLDYDTYAEALGEPL